MQNYALIRQGAGNAVLKAIPTPDLRPDYILVRTVAVALNPTDWTSLDAVGNDGTGQGCDYSGVVEEVGTNVRRFRKGDRVAGVSHGSNDADPETGSFARFVLAKAALAMHIPEHVSFEDAATVAVGIGTTGYALYRVLNLPRPGQRDERRGKPVLINGGSTAAGSIAIQFAKMSGRRVITTASPRNFEMVKARGADAVYDYRDPEVGAKIRKDTNGEITEILDTVGIESSAAICAEAMGPAGGECAQLLEVQSPRSDIKTIFFLGYSLSGEEYVAEGETFPAEPELHSFANEFMASAERLWGEGKWIPHPKRAQKGGLQGVIDGMQLMREGKYSGEKLVYRVEETDWP